ncbi:hypothetical protein MMAD_55860 (plasmid) [Mycolicibacterium madagascariense]|uniref:Uncharacterized protein n=1 Tax=Mycolicibacterium madagascariense TaxID=212765 RepID=A0A7I7XPX2_9MYCO|nr:hypothetical protein [Mycolicibacterium madagascariense]BBZ31291.1 hypothetical protein MMAD_55860 [Mycolicibacterium madagascariense]
MSDLTTIKVSKPLRERISAGAAEEGETVQKFLEQLMEGRERQKRLSSVAAAISGADEETLTSWRTETADWATVDADTDPTQ